MSPFTLSDQTVLITGGLGAIAEFILKTLSDAGAALVITDRQPETEPIDLRGGHPGTPVPIREGQLKISLHAYAPASFLLD